MIEPVTGWSKITQYDLKRAISIANLVETTWLTRYPRPMKITYDQESEFIVHGFTKYLIETEYWITDNPSTLENPTFSGILERIHPVIGNLVRTFNMKETYVDKDEPCLSILAEAAFTIISKIYRLKYYILKQLVFGCDMILPIKHNADW